MEKEYDVLLKLLLIGDSSVGKSSVLIKFTDGTFNSSFIATVGVDFKTRTVEIEGTKLKLQVWDSAGQERFRTIVSAFFRGAMGIILVYDITDEKSFDNIKHWIKSIKENAAPDVEKMILGNKYDLQEQRAVSTERGKQLAEEYGVKFMETSAKTGYNIENIFVTLARDIKHKLDAQAVNVGDSNSSSNSSSATAGGNNVRVITKIEGKDPRSGRCCNNN